MAEVAPGTLAGDLQVSDWQVTLHGVGEDAAELACRDFLAADHIEVERVTAKGVRRVDARAAVLTLELDRRAVHSGTGGCAILRMVVRHMAPAVRPDDVLAALRQVAGLAPPSPPLVTRLAQGPLGTSAGGLCGPGLRRSTVADCGAGAAVFRQVLFSSHLLCFGHFLLSPRSSESSGPCGNRLVKTRG